MVHPATKRAALGLVEALGCPVDLGLVWASRPGEERGRGSWAGCDLSPVDIAASLEGAAAANARGANIFVRVREASGHPGVLILDDLDATALQRMCDTGWSPTAVVETSPENYQAWARLVPVGATMSRDIATAVLRRLVPMFGSDARAMSPVQPGRLPGFTNRKPKHETNSVFPFVRLTETAPGLVAPAAADLLAELSAFDTLPAQPGRAAGAPETPAAPADEYDQLDVFEHLDAIRSEEAERIARETVFGRRPLHASSASEVDFAAVCRALDEEVEQTVIAAWLRSRRPEKAADYADRTVQAAIARREAGTSRSFGYRF